MLPLVQQPSKAIGIIWSNEPWCRDIDKKSQFWLSAFYVFCICLQRCFVMLMQDDQSLKIQFSFMKWEDCQIETHCRANHSKAGTIPYHTSCIQFIMNEKCGQSMDNGGKKSCHWNCLESTNLFEWNWPGPNVSTSPLRQWGFRQCLPFSWTTLRVKHCRHPIAVHCKWLQANNRQTNL